MSSVTLLKSALSKRRTKRPSTATSREPGATQKKTFNLSLQGQCTFRGAANDADVDFEAITVPADALKKRRLSSEPPPPPPTHPYTYTHSETSCRSTVCCGKSNVVAAKCASAEPGENIFAAANVHSVAATGQVQFC